MQELQIFKNEEFGEIRTVTIGNQPYFVGKDVAVALGYRDTVNALKKHVDDEDKTRGCQNAAPSVTDDLGRIQYPTWINESGLYTLILSSKLPTAKKFKRWVTSEVLPSIRKYGTYMTAETIEAALLNPDTIIRLAMSLKEEQEAKRKLTLENTQQKQVIGEMQPKATYYDTILDNPGLVTITQIAKDYGMSGKAMNKLLHSYGVQYCQSGQWLLYQKYHDKGYTHSQTVDIKRSDGTTNVKMNTKWTQKGRLFLYELLKSNDILPIIEIDKNKKSAYITPQKVNM